jgi:hypothetical protein
LRLGAYLAEMDQTERAVSLLESAASDDPDGLTALGVAYLRLAGPPTRSSSGNTPRRSLERQCVPYAHLGMKLAAGRMDEARTCAQQFIDSAPASRRRRRPHAEGAERIATAALMKKPRPQSRKPAAPARAAAPAPPRSGNAGWIALIAILAVAAVGAWLYSSGMRGRMRSCSFRSTRFGPIGCRRRLHRRPDAGIDPLRRRVGRLRRAYAHAPQHCRHTRRCSPGSCRSSIASATTWASRWRGTVDDGVALRRRGTTAGFASAYVLRPETGISQGFSLFDAALPAASGDQAPAKSSVRSRHADGHDDVAEDARGRQVFSSSTSTTARPTRLLAVHALPDKYDGGVAFSDRSSDNCSLAARARMVRRRDVVAADPAKGWATIRKKSTGCSSIGAIHGR